MRVGIIPDGNRRWAKQNGFDSSYGHTVGILNLSRIIEYALPQTDHLYVYLLAWHNWERDEDELYNLFNLYVPLVHKYYNHPKITLQLGHPPRQISKPIDVIIRTGSHDRLSGFFPEESRTAKLIVLEKYWPDFTPQDFDEAVK